MNDQTESLERQRELYGEPLHEIATRITSCLDLTQGRLAEVLGLSAPMLSQLLSGRRIKIGNLAAVGRLQALTQLVETSGQLSEAERAAKVAEIQQTTPTLTTAPSGSLAVAALQAAATPEELSRLAALSQAPALTALLQEAAHQHG